jgi:hypothetical protein
MLENLVQSNNSDSTLRNIIAALTPEFRTTIMLVLL